MVRNFTTRRAGGSETALRSQPGSREAALRGLRGNQRFHLGAPMKGFYFGGIVNVTFFSNLSNIS